MLSRNAKPVEAERHLADDIRFEDAKGSLLFDPKDDATPIEAIRLSALFMVASCGGGGGKWREYVERHGLTRHFRVPR